VNLCPGGPKHEKSPIIGGICLEPVSIMFLFRVILPATIDHLGDFIASLSRWLQQQGLAAEKIGRVQLAVEEALVNIIRYAYREKPGEVEVRGGIVEDNRFIIEILDSGVPFNVCSLPQPDVKCGIRERKVGGLGVFLIQKMVDELIYRREGDKNVLTMIIAKNNGRCSRSRPDVRAGA